jgi:diacylglycerol O-acyltransferase / wax synthase
MEKLSGQDALFLHLDLPHAAAHLTMIYIYDPSGMKRPLGFREIVRHVEKRLHTSPMFRRRIVQVPFGLGYPYWAEDERFHIDFHMRHFALPKPGDLRQFCILASRIHARTMDLSRPPWEMYVIEGLDNVAGLPKGSFAILTKMHHAAVDGTAAAELTWALHDIAGGKGRSVPVVRRQKHASKQSAPAGFVDSVTRIFAENASSMIRLAAPLARVLPKLSIAAAQLMSRTMFTPKGGAPRTRFNGDIVDARVFETVTLELDDVKRIKNAVEGATVNDVVLAIIGGAMRRYLAAKKELPRKSLVALAPVNTRQDAAERKTTGNTISFLTFPLATDIESPLARVAAVRAATAQTKAINAAIGARDLTDLSRFAPPATLAFAGRLATLTGLGGKGPVPLHNCIVTNVPGSTVPLTMLGARLVYWSGVGPISDGVSLVWAVSSYCGKMFISPTSAPNIVPDPEFLAQCVRDSLAELRKAAARPAAKAAAARTRPRRGSVKTTVGTGGSA